MNKVIKLLQKERAFSEKIHKQINKIQSKCKHKNVETHRGYAGTDSLCKDCEKWL